MVEISMVVPTYNESENIENLLRAVSKTLEGYDYEIIVVDDNSPDGTAGIIQEYAAGVDRIRLLVRSGKLGLGSAILDGFRMAKGNYFLMLDADLSHRPEDIKRLIDNRKGADIVIGSRYIKGGKIIGWPLKRRIISRSAVVLAKNLFRLKVKDPVSGFALYKKEIFERQSRKLDLTVTEIPITFLERKNGQSKLNTDEIINFIKLCWRLRI
ncbi:MAG: polyprenol monophosphomannose synthase [Candidatus Methanoperedens sp.]|nr:polyprenol monophosphomannose synthase [Candidatus Methanoperedens sp.]